VVSGVALVGGALFSNSEKKAPERTAIASSHVTFNRLDDPTVEIYLRSGEWRDRAGGYAIQGLGSLLVESLQGDFSNVVGLPLRTLLELEPALLR
jgi:septum formation protein